MKLNDLVAELGLTVLNEGENFDRTITGGYTSDLLSDVMGNIEEGMVWVTLQIHRNTIAVASLKEVAAVVLIAGASPDEDTLEQARNEGVTLLSTDMPAFEASGCIYHLINN